MTRKVDFIRELKRQGHFDIDDVVRWTNRLLPHFVPAQQRYKVSDKVTIRTVRYYLNLALISKPDGYRCRHAMFGSIHVIQILAIKALQAQYVPLKKIAQIMDSAGEPELLAWLSEDGHAVRPALPTSAWIESTVNPINSGNALFEIDSAETRNRNWRRIPIHDDIELNLSPGFNLYDHYLESGAILPKIMQALTSRVRPTSKRVPTRGEEALPNGPAQAIKNLSRTVIALVTEGGLVPHGNPDGLPLARSTGFLRYSLEGLNDFVAGQFESVDRGWDNTHVNKDPDRLLPMDVMRELESQHLFSRLHQFFFSTTGAGTTVENARQIGRGIAREIKAQGVSAVVLTAT